MLECHREPVFGGYANIQPLSICSEKMHASTNDWNPCNYASMLRTPHSSPTNVSFNTTKSNCGSPYRHVDRRRAVDVGGKQRSDGVAGR